MEDYGTCAGKADKQLNIEMQAALTEAGIEGKVSFDRRRGRVCLVVQTPDIDAASAIMLSKHPDFHFRYENPNHGDTHFLYFSQVVKVS